MHDSPRGNVYKKEKLGKSSEPMGEANNKEPLSTGSGFNENMSIHSKFDNWHKEDVDM